MSNVVNPVAVTPQIASGAPEVSCPQCGRRMQLLSTTNTSFSYVCYAHSPQNAESAEPYYLNLHKFTDENGRVKYGLIGTRR